MYKYSVGDRVRIINKHNDDYGEMGRVTKMDNDGFPYLVKGYWHSENDLELAEQPTTPQYPRYFTDRSNCTNISDDRINQWIEELQDKDSPIVVSRGNTLVFKIGNATYVCKDFSIYNDHSEVE